MFIIIFTDTTLPILCQQRLGRRIANGKIQIVRYAAGLDENLTGGSNETCLEADKLKSVIYVELNGPHFQWEAHLSPAPSMSLRTTSTSELPDNARELSISPLVYWRSFVDWLAHIDLSG